ATAPISVLCSRCAPDALMTTGNPSSAAAAAASPAGTSRPRGTATPQAASACLPACSLSDRIPVADADAGADALCAAGAGDGSCNLTPGSPAHAPPTAPA